MESEHVRIPAFGHLTVQPTATLGFTSGNVPFVGYTEGIDNMRLRVGQCLPLETAKAEVFNPYSFPLEGQIVRGAPITTNIDGEFLAADMDLRNLRGGTQLAADADAGRRRGLGFMSKRGSYRVSIIGINGSYPDTQLMFLRGASVEFLQFKPAGAFPLSVPMYRHDGSQNDQLMCIAGSYSQAEIDTWKAAVGFAAPEVKFTCNSSVNFQVDDKTAVFFTTSNLNAWRLFLEADELGDFSGVRRIVGGN